MRGYVPPSGSGENGVLLLGEAAGEHEAKEGMGFIGKAGLYLFQNLQRVGIDRDAFKIDNIIHCQPPMNKLAGMPYEAGVIESCRPNLEATIADMQAQCKASGKHFTILTLGKIAFKAVMGLTDKDPIVRHDYIAYPFWNAKYSCFVVPAYHPSYLMRGFTHLVPVLQFAAQRAIEIADKGLRFAMPDYLLDPTAKGFEAWIEEFVRAYESDPSLILSYDIETPMKQGANEEEVAKEDDDDYTILRCSFSYKRGHAVSVPWNAEMRRGLEELFSHPVTKCGWNCSSYDRPRIQAQMPIKGDELDGMLMWHVLNSALPKGLGFVAPFYVPDVPVWKYMSDAQPALYNAIDADVAWQCVQGIKRDLIKQNMWPVLERHVIEVHKVFNYMSEQGVLIDQELRASAEKQLATALDAIEDKMEVAVPKEARKWKIAKKAPKDLAGWEETSIGVVEKFCQTCGLSLKRKWKKHSELCSMDAVVELEVPTMAWQRPLEFKVSKLGLTNYQKSLRHQAIISRRERKVTYDEKAMLQLMKKYPKDPLYPLILEHRGTQKLLSNYIGVTELNGKIRGGLPLGPDGRVHCTFTSNPSTLRSACQSPNLQNQVRPKGPNDPASIIRNLFMAAPGCAFTATDFSGIEARLVGYFAGDPDYIRLTGIDIHSFYTAYAINALDGRIKPYDLPLLTWDDARLTDYLRYIKKEFKADRNDLYKHLVHAKNFGQSPRGAQEKILLETGTLYPLASIARVMDVYDELFPKIKKWQWNTLLQVEKDGFLRNPFGYIHRFTRPFEYEWFGREVQKKQGVDASKVWAFGPQSTAAGIIKEAMLRLFFERFDEAGQYLRLLIHDELFAEVPEEFLQVVTKIMQDEMSKPIPELPLPRSWGMGDYLTIGVESKTGYRWGSLK